MCKLNIFKYIEKYPATIHLKYIVYKTMITIAQFAALTAYPYDSKWIVCPDMLKCLVH